MVKSEVNLVISIEIILINLSRSEKRKKKQNSVHSSSKFISLICCNFTYLAKSVTWP